MNINCDCQYLAIGYRMIYIIILYFMVRFIYQMILKYMLRHKFIVIKTKKHGTYVNNKYHW